MRANRKQNALNRILAFVLAMILTLSFVFDRANIAIAADGNGDFQISLSWNKNDDPDHFVYDSGSPETKLVRLKIAYSNKEVSKAFAPGDLTITVTGLKDAVRSGKSCSDPFVPHHRDRAQCLYLSASLQGKYEAAS